MTMTMTSGWYIAERDQPRSDQSRHGTRSALRAALEDVPQDDEFSRHLAAAAALLRSELTGRHARA
jgi:hypothetical protein